jgi:murein DD-endopeptidase MepM/ murein hydrolase activator NlpD
MLFRRFKNLLPKRLTDRVALKTLASQHLLLRSRGFRKQPRYTVFPKISKIIFGGLFLLYFSGYQPTLAIPPVKQSIAHAEFSQEQKINSTNLPQAFILPHPGYLSTKFSIWHPGIDIATGLGMPIHPVADGTVDEVIYSLWGLGHYIVLAHPQGYKSTYGHMGRIFVKKGDSVTQSSIIGEVGLTGHTTGAHTHLEITKDDKYIDPLTVLPSLQDWPASAGIAPQGQGEEKIIVTPTPKTKKEVNKTGPGKEELNFLKQLSGSKETKQSPLLPLPSGQF